MSSDSSLRFCDMSSNSPSNKSASEGIVSILDLNFYKNIISIKTVRKN